MTHLLLSQCVIQSKIILGDQMLYFHKELKENLKSDNQIQNAVEEKRYFKVDDVIANVILYFNSLETIQV